MLYEVITDIRSDRAVSLALARTPRRATPRRLACGVALYTPCAQPVSRSRAPGVRPVVCARLALGLALSGCEADDPLEAFRQQQAAGDYVGSSAPRNNFV